MVNWDPTIYDGTYQWIGEHWLKKRDFCDILNLPSVIKICQKKTLHRKITSKSWVRIINMLNYNKFQYFIFICGLFILCLVPIVNKGGLQKYIKYNMTAEI